MTSSNPRPNLVSWSQAALTPFSFYESILQPSYPCLRIPWSHTIPSHLVTLALARSRDHTNNHLLRRKPINYSSDFFARFSWVHSDTRLCLKSHLVLTKLW